MAVTFETSPPASSSASIITSREERKHREVRPLPYRLRQAIAVYLENKQYLEGFKLLNSVLTAGVSTPNALGPLVAPPIFYELAATLVVHPLSTTRAKSAEDAQAADEALRFVRNTCRVVGPLRADLASAFLFRTARSTRRKRKFDDYTLESTSNSDDEDGDEDQLRSPYVSEKSVFRQKEGFWLVVGWAFHCSVKHKKRWERWKLWLGMMIEVLGEDFGDRALARKDTDVHGEWARTTLLAQYIESGSGRGRVRRVLNAVLADGSEKCMREYGEVFKNETRERKSQKEVEALEQRKKLNLDENEWGDYGGADDEEDEALLNEETDSTTEMTDVYDFGGADSMSLRQKLIILLVNMAVGAPVSFVDVEELYDVLTELLRSLPLPIYRDFLASLVIEERYHTALLLNLLLPFLATAPRSPQVFDAPVDYLIKHYLPHAANSITYVDNAKMSLLIEHLVYNLWSTDSAQSNPAFSSAVQRGIAARSRKPMNDGRRSDKARLSVEETEAKIVLETSAERIGLLLSMMDPDCTAGAGEERGIKLYAESSSSQLSDLVQTPSSADGEDDGDETMVG